MAAFWDIAPCSLVVVEIRNVYIIYAAILEEKALAGRLKRKWK
jgi:hypothetical protein